MNYKWQYREICLLWTKGGGNENHPEGPHPKAQHMHIFSLAKTYGKELDHRSLGSFGFHVTQLVMLEIVSLKVNKHLANAYHTTYHLRNAHRTTNSYISM